MSNEPRRAEERNRAAGGKFPQDVSRLKGWAPARQVVDPVRAKLPTRRVTINLDEDVIAIFKAEALRGEPPYQVAINQALRAYLHEREASNRERTVERLLVALDDEAVQRKLRSIR